MKVTARALALVLAACRSGFGDGDAVVDAPRILAVRADPAEAKPGDAVALTALYTDGTTARDDARPSWLFCAGRRALASADPIDPGCIDGSAAIAIGAGTTTTATLPRDACQLFGPERALPRAGEPAGRPADPDGTGGFFQPGLVGDARTGATLFDVRVQCTLGSVSQDVALDFAQRYRPNQNPAFAVTPGGAVTAARGQVMHVAIAWPACDGDTPCGGAERYVAYDPAARSLAARREAMTVAWLATRGRFASPRTGRGEDDPRTDSAADWTAPDTAGAATLFVVLRDSRGGAAFHTLSVVVE